MVIITHYTPNEYLTSLLLNDYEKIILFLSGFCNIKFDITNKEEITQIIKILRNLNIPINKTKLKKLLKIPFYNLPTYMIKNHTSTKYRDVKTINNIPFDLAKSALQKYIRRGIINKAQYIMSDIYLMNWFPESQGSLTNFFNRLRIIYLEDISIAAPNLIYMVNDILPIKTPYNITKLSNHLPCLIKCMSTSLHTRCYSHIRGWFKTNNPDLPPSPKYHYNLGEDENTSLTVPANRNLTLRQVVNAFIWCMENKKIETYYWIHHILEKEKLKVKRYNSTRSGFLIFDILNKTNMITSRDTFNICLNWYKHMSMKEQFLCVLHPVMLYILSNYVSKYVPNPSPTNYDIFYNAYNGSLLNENILINSYVYDKHTAIGRGKKMDRGYADFAFEGSLVAYDLEIFPEMAENYVQNYLKSVGLNKPPSETKEFTFKNRTQLNTMGNKPDVYFAKNLLGMNVVVKGPYMSKEQAMLPFKLHNIMMLFEGINTFDVNIQLLLPDLWDKVPLGSRNKLGKGYQYFIVMEDILNKENYPIMKKSSKMWDNEEVVDYDELFKRHSDISFGKPSDMTKKARFSMLIQLAFRLAFQIGDNSYRNFIRVNDTVYNIDLEGIGIGGLKGPAIAWKQEEIDLLNQTRNEYWNEYSEIVGSWLGPGTGYISRWDIFQTTLNTYLSDINIDKIKDNIKKLIVKDNIIRKN